MKPYHPPIAIAHSPGQDVAVLAQKAFGRLLSTWWEFERAAREMYPHGTDEEVFNLVSEYMNDFITGLKP